MFHFGFHEWAMSNVDYFPLQQTLQFPSSCNPKLHIKFQPWKTKDKNVYTIISSDII